MPTCAGVIEAHRIRVALSNKGGVPQPGPENGFVTDGVVSLATQLEYEGARNVTSFKGSGDLCQVLRAAGRPSAATFNTELCRLDNPLKVLTIGGKILGDDDLGGWDAPAPTDPIIYSIWELWTASWNGTIQKVDASGDPVWTVFVAGVATAELGAETTDKDNFMVTPYTLTSLANPNLPVSGPFGDWPAYIATDGGIEGVMGYYETTFLPDAACEFIEVPAVY